MATQSNSQTTPPAVEAQEAPAITTNARTLTEDQVFGILSSRAQISKPGTYDLRVNQITEYHDAVRGTRFIVNLAAMSTYGKAQAMESMFDGDFVAALNTNLTANLRPSDYRPKKGEIVKVKVDLVPLKSIPGEFGLLVTNLSEIQSEPTTKLDFRSAMEAFKKSKEEAAKSNG